MCNNIVFICDNNYVLATTIAVTSMVENLNENDYFEIFILCDNVSKENQNMFRNMSTINIKISIVEVNSNKYIGLEKEYSSVSKASLLKFSIPNILKNIDKALYVDGDILVIKDIIDIFKIELGDNYAAVIKDGPKNKIAGGKKHSFYGKNEYFNSGVMYLNLKKMRQDNIPDKLINYRLNEYNYFMDQDAFNKVLEKKVVYISVLYDFMLHLISFRNEKYSLEQLIKFYELEDYDSLDELTNNVKIFHYTYQKPWKYIDIPFNEIWMNYFYKSPLKTLKLNRKSYTTEIINSKTYRIGKIFSKTIMLIKKIVKFK